MKYRVCPECGANLDHNERCRCHIDRTEREAWPAVSAGDTVRYRPTGEEWEVCGVSYDRGRLIPDGLGFPVSVDIGDCELIERGPGYQTLEQIERLKRQGLVAYIEK